ncbi:MAG: tetratricopeptide repeat protein, partial [Armatimonadota bacterium]|nr:tetratricopeptide repeat protein [Armatimonadota bacterium]
MTIKAHLTGLALFFSTLSLLGSIQPVAAQQEKRDPHEPVFSRDAKQIVYVEKVTKGGEVLPSTGEIWTVNVDGTNARGLTAGHKDEHPRFSPDGQKIVFTRNDDIWLINADGSGLRNVTNSKASEDLPEFTNDGQGLVFLRTGSKDPTAEEAKIQAEIIAKEPLAALGLGQSYHTVVLHNLADGHERVLLGDNPDDFDVEQVVPNPSDDNAFFILCKPLDNDDKPVAGYTSDKVVAVLKRDGSPPRTVFALKPESKMRLSRLRVAPTRNLLEVDLTDKTETQVGLLENGDITLLPDAPTSGDVSFDGRLIVGTGPIDELFHWGLVLYDIADKKSGSLSAFKNAIPAKAKEFFDKGKEHYDEERYIEAIAEFTKAIVVHPPYAEAYYQRAWTHDMKDDQKSALSDLGEAIRLNPNNAEFYLTRARIYQENERTGEALDDLNAAIKADPKNADAYYQRGRLRMEREEVAEAIEDFDAAIKLEPEHLSYLLARGDAFLKQGDNPAAIVDYTAAIKRYPDSW